VSTKLLVISAIALAALGTTGCAAEIEEDDEVAESEDKLLAGRRLSESEIARHLRTAGFPERVVGTMVCTAKYESSFYERASNRNRNGTMDRGLFQINSIHIGDMRGCPTSADPLWNASTNAKCAYAIYKAQGLNAWYGYRKHRTECNNYRAPASSSASSTAPEPEAVGDGGCWSGTLQDTVDARTCVESKYDGVWFQCMNGKWYRGVSGNTGPYGTCASTHPL
jgi:hypothetical protein